MKNSINKEANPSTLGMYCGDNDQEPKLQRSSKAGRKKQEKCDRATLHTKRVCKKTDLISSKDHSQPSKHVAFLSLQNPNSPHQAMWHNSPKVNIAMLLELTWWF